MYLLRILIRGMKLILGIILAILLLSGEDDKICNELYQLFSPGSKIQMTKSIQDHLGDSIAQNKDDNEE